MAGAATLRRWWILAAGALRYALTAAMRAARAARAAIAGLLAAGRAWVVASVLWLARWAGIAARAAAVVVLVSVVLAGGAYAASILHGQYGAGQDALDARTWAGRTQTLSRTACLTCHSTLSAVEAAGPHDKLTCEACHGPLADHPAAPANSVTGLTVPTSVVCITCHAQTSGRPAGFPVVDPTAHYSGGVCLRCHDPHAVVAVAPPDVVHPLAKLPPCTTCHAPDGLKKLPTGHELVADTVCLSCHGVPKGGA